MVQKAMARYEILLAVPQSSAGVLTSCQVNYAPTAQEVTEKDQEKKSSSTIGEGYTLQIELDGFCAITASDERGILRGLETFSQLFIREQDGVVLEFAPLLITDTPRFGHRGLLIDTSRHYLSFDTIIAIIDSLVVSKFNVLHIHAVDAQSFPLNVSTGQSC